MPTFLIRVSSVFFYSRTNKIYIPFNYREEPVVYPRARRGPTRRRASDRSVEKVETVCTRRAGRSDRKPVPETTVVSRTARSSVFDRLDDARSGGERERDIKKKKTIIMMIYVL